MLKRFVMLLCLLALLQAFAVAQKLGPTHRTWELDLFLGSSSLGERTFSTQVVATATQTSRQTGLRYAVGTEWGARFLENLGQHWGGAVEYSFTNQPLTFKNLSDQIPSLHLGHSVHRFAYDVLYFPMSCSKRLRPYVYAGPGVTLFAIHKDSRSFAQTLGIKLSDPWKVTFNWGGGVKYLLKDHLAANLQVSDAVSGIPRYGLPRSALVLGGLTAPGFSPRGRMNNWRIGAGVVFQWDEW